MSSAVASRQESPVTNRSLKVALPRVAYMMSRFPKLTETFVINEIVAARRMGASIEIFPLRREPGEIQQPEVQELLPLVHFTTWLSFSMLVAVLYYGCRRPVRFCTTVWTLLRANWGSPRFLGAAVLFFPKACYLAREMKRREIDHVHAHFCSHPAMAAFVIRQLAGIPFSFTAHGSDLHVDRHMLKEKVAAASFVATVSEYNRSIILEECGETYADKVAVVHCGIDPTKFAAVDSQTQYAQGGPFQVSCVGTLHEVKGQEYLMRAISQLDEANVICHLIGDGRDRAALESLAEQLGVQQQVVFHGSCDREKVFAILSQMDASVCPSVQTTSGQREGIPVALMEAMAVGVPVIGSQISGIPELIEDGVTGLLTAPRSPDEIAAAIRRLMASAELRRGLSENALRKIDAEFSLEACTRRLFELLQEGAAQ